MKKVLLAALPLVAVLAACGGDDDDAAAACDAPCTVTVDDNTFEPETATIAAGDTVTWSFEGNSAHNVTFDEGESSQLVKDGEFERTFDEAGDFDYTCTVHPGMEGTVVVAASATGSE